jgi:hypothetical protein
MFRVFFIGFLLNHLLREGFPNGLHCRYSPTSPARRAEDESIKPSKLPGAQKKALLVNLADFIMVEPVIYLWGVA